MLAPPADPLAAVTHPDPYGYYAGLVDGPALVFDERLRLWIAAKASIVETILSDPRCRVRPMHEPVPAAIAGGSAGEVFSHLVRMNEGAAHAAPKLVLQRALASVDEAALVRTTGRLMVGMDARPDTTTGLSAWTFELPVSVVASTLGFPEDELPGIAAWMRDFVACLSPLSTQAQIAGSHAAAACLLDRMKSLIAASGADSQSLAAVIAREASAAGWDRSDAIVSNLVGLLSQTYDATAGLIGNGIVALTRNPELRDEIANDPQRMRLFVDEVIRHDPSVQNTRRFVGQDMQIDGSTLHAGDAVLVVLAAANRDAAANPDPDRFQLDRPNRRIFSFGHARHACPGQALASTIAACALSAVARSPVSVPAYSWRYRPSANARIPVFIDPQAQESTT
jgi:cytochrome P450